MHVCRTLKNLKTLQSPVFLSTMEDGQVQEGCGGIPLDRPLLLVSNHQTFALDIGPLVEGLLRQTGLLPRGLTHPAVFQVCFVSSFLYLPPLLLTFYVSPVYCLHSRRRNTRVIAAFLQNTLCCCFWLAQLLCSAGPPSKLSPCMARVSQIRGCAVGYIQSCLSALFGFLPM